MWCLAVIMSVKMKLKYQITNILLSHEYKLAQSIVKKGLFEIIYFSRILNTILLPANTDELHFRPGFRRWVT